jgi:hypothetical protein
MEEGFEETLILHKLAMFEKLGIYTDRICDWKNSHQRQRWAA